MESRRISYRDEGRTQREEVSKGAAEKGLGEEAGVNGGSGRPGEPHGKRF